MILEWRSLPEGMGGLWQPGKVVLDPRLSRVERRCALMHELVHDERRIGWPFATAATMEKEEATVRKETALRLVPAEELHRLVFRSDVEPVTAMLVAAEFDVTSQVAHHALRWLNAALLEAELRASARASAA